MKTKRINGQKAKGLVEKASGVYHLGGFETGKRVNMSRVKNLIDNDLWDLNAGVDFSKDENNKSLYPTEYINGVKVRFQNNEGVAYEVWFDGSMKLYTYETEKATYLIAEYVGFVNVYRLIASEPEEKKEETFTVVLANYPGLVGDLQAKIRMCERLDYKGLENIKFETSEYFDFVKVTGESEKVVKAFLGRGDRGYLKYALENDKEKKGTHVSKGIKYGISYQADMNGRCDKCAAKGNCPRDRYGFLKCVEFSTVSGSFAYFVKPEVKSSEPIQREPEAKESGTSLVNLESGQMFDYKGKLYYKGDNVSSNVVECWTTAEKTLGTEAYIPGDKMVLPVNPEQPEQPTLVSIPVYVPFKFEGSNKVYEKKKKYSENTFECIEEGGELVYASGLEGVTLVETKALKELEYGHKFLLNGRIWFKGDSDNNGSFVCYDKHYMTGNTLFPHGDVLVAPLEHEGNEYRPVFDIDRLNINQYELIRDIMGNALNSAYWDKEEQVYVLQGLDMAISESEYNELKAVRYEY